MCEHDSTLVRCAKSPHATALPRVDADRVAQYMRRMFGAPTVPVLVSQASAHSKAGAKEREKPGMENGAKRSLGEDHVDSVQTACVQVQVCGRSLSVERVCPKIP
jgi:hypothetical protein